jgi:two-component system cell cycle response regulator
MAQHVLIVDDEPEAITLMRLMLKTFNHDSEGVTTGTEAIAHARARQPLLILLDLMLPDRTGFDVCAELKALPETAHIPIIVLSARDDREARERARAAGADQFAAKPIRRTQIGEFLEMALAAAAKRDNRGV